MLVGVQLFVPGSYLPPELKVVPPNGPSPPQTIISLPVHTAVCTARASGALVVLVAVQLSIAGMYLPPVPKGPDPGAGPYPPQTTISLPVHTAV